MLMFSSREYLHLIRFLIGTPWLTRSLTSKRLFGSLRKSLFLHQSAFHVFARNGVGVYRWRCLQSRISGVDKESIWLNGQAEMRTIFTVQEVP